MPEINYRQLDAHIKEPGSAPGKKTFPAVYLIYGEELLNKKAHDAIVAALLPGDSRRHNFESIQGDNQNIPEVLNRMNTYSLLSGTKVVSFQDTRVFDTHQQKDKLLDKTKAAYENRDMRKAAQYFLSVMAQLGLTFEDLRNDEGGRLLLSEGATDMEWLDKIILHCAENEFAIPADKDYAKLLEDAVIKGFPKKNHLIITSDFVDHRRGLYEAVRHSGMVVDCSVPKGSRQADRQLQEDVVRERAQSLLTPAKKKIDSRAFAELYELTGFDLRTFSGNLEKLILYVGDRETITSEDVAATADRTREDPVFELTGAVSDRDAQKSMFYLNAILGKGGHPLQILAGLINHFRKMLLAKAFVESSHGRAWRTGINFNQFKVEVIPAIKAYDKALLEMVDAWEPLNKDSGGDRVAAEKKRKTGKKKNPAADLLIAQNPSNPYPIYLLLKRTDRFTMAALLKAYEEMGTVDMELKSTARNPRILLETLVLHICSGFWPLKPEVF